MRNIDRCILTADFDILTNLSTYFEIPCDTLLQFWEIAAIFLPEKKILLHMFSI